MREIKFRGQRTDTKEWVYGYYYFGKRQDTSCVNSTCIMTDGLIFDVIPETVGQYTGRKDKNGKEIYDGDKIRAPGTVEEGMYWEVLRHKNGCWYLRLHSHFYNQNLWHTKNIEDADEVIGNIYENKELLNGKS